MTRLANSNDYRLVREALAQMPADVSSDAVGRSAPKAGDMYAPSGHSSALDADNPIVLGSRGSGKSFWSGILGQNETRKAAALAYPHLGLNRIIAQFGYTGGVSELGSGTGLEALRDNLPENACPLMTQRFWWATIIRACQKSADEPPQSFRDLMALDWEAREQIIAMHDTRLRQKDFTLLVVYDAVDTVATSWSQRRRITEALLEVVWATRAFNAIKAKVFLRPDQIYDQGLKQVELPKLRSGAVNLTWEPKDLYGLLFARLALLREQEAYLAFRNLLESAGFAIADQDAILRRDWSLLHSEEEQARLMDAIAGKYMASGPHGYKKGKTYAWPLTHLADAKNEVTPRSFLELMIFASRHGATPKDRVLTPEGIRHGLRAASKTRVDQLHLEFPWIKGVLAPLAGLLLPQDEKKVFEAWRATKTVGTLLDDARKNNYLPPFDRNEDADEKSLFIALQNIGVMFVRKDERLDMPDLFRVAAPSCG